MLQLRHGRTLCAVQYQRHRNSKEKNKLIKENRHLGEDKHERETVQRTERLFQI